MANTPTAVVLNAGTRLLVQNLGVNRTLTQYTVTVNTAATIGATSVSLKLTTGTLFLQSGTKLDFGIGKVIETVGDFTLTSTGVSVPIKTALTTALATTDTAQTYGLLRCLGGNDATFTVKDNEVSTRSFESGLFDDAHKVMVGGTIAWKGFYVLNDKAIVTVIEPASLTDAEIYVQIEYPDGKIRKGVGYVQGYTEAAALDGIRNLNWTFRLVGDITVTYPTP